MSLIENLSPRRRGRPPKPRAPEMTPVAAALASPLPAGADAALEKIEAAVRAKKTAYEVLAAARSDDAKTAVDTELTKAQSALQRAYAQREVAERLGDDDAPDDETIAALETVVAAAKAKADGFTPKIAALEHEHERRREILRSAVDSAGAILRPFESALDAAIGAQVELAANLLGEAQAAERVKQNLGDLQFPATLQSKPGGRGFTGTGHAPAPETLRRVYRVIFDAEREASRAAA